MWHCLDILALSFLDFRMYFGSPPSENYTNQTSAVLEEHYMKLGSNGVSLEYIFYTVDSTRRQVSAS